jgi:NAD(P)-dependent dehydrogenase (short-subunit alcohol dehydrogenase family)
MTVSYEGQVAIVTGAGRGLGRSYAMEIAKLGGKVVVNDLGGSVTGEASDARPAEEVVAEIKAAGGEAVPNFDSVSSYEGGYNMVKQAMDTWGRLDTIVCNAGILRDRAIHNMSEDEWDQVLAVHLKGCYTLVRHAWPVFRQQSYGRVVMATSGSGLWGNFGQANYAAAKMGMVGFMNTLKMEGEKYNINVHCLGPAAATRMTENLMPQERLDQMSPDHVAPVVAFLGSSSCTDSGLVIEAAGGHYNRSQMVKGPGLDFDTADFKSTDWVEENWGKITSIEGAQAMWGMGQTREQHYAAKV